MFVRLRIYPASYRPISDLSFLCKVIEKVVDARLCVHISSNRLLPLFQSVYRPYHTTETAVISILNDMIGVIDQGRLGVLMLYRPVRGLRHGRPLCPHRGDEGTVRRRGKCSRVGGRLPEQQKPMCSFQERQV